MPIKPAHIIERSDGPRIEGTRITVYTILEYLRAGRTRDYIAATLFISSAQVEAAMEYIRDHEAEVNAEFDGIMERIRKGNPPEIEARLQPSREKLQALLADPEKLAAWRASRQAASRAAPT